ncbi:hypothetical protein [Halanaeroarchaeum sulfurireducens]|nr:hypothetical protein [Halanaeroarchaeum sulfurireducens]
MQRRKFLATVGSLTAGSAAALGTGAFTSVTADRSVTVEVAGDSEAYLGLEAVSASPNSQYVEKSDGEISFDFSAADNDGSPVDGGGNGFNPDSETRINDLLHVTNQGTQSFNYWVNVSQLGAGSDFVTIEASGYSSISGNMGSTTGASKQLAYDGGNADDVELYQLGPGDDNYLHLVVDAKGESPNNFAGTVTFVAEHDGVPGSN